MKTKHIHTQCHVMIETVSIAFDAFLIIIILTKLLFVFIIFIICLINHRWFFPSNSKMHIFFNFFFILFSVFITDDSKAAASPHSNLDYKCIFIRNGNKFPCNAVMNIQKQVYKFERKKTQKQSNNKNPKLKHLWNRRWRIYMYVVRVFVVVIIK